MKDLISLNVISDLVIFIFINRIVLNSKAIYILKSLSISELKSFKDFVNSPFHNKNKNVIKLFNALKQFYPDFDQYGLTKEKLYKKIYPSKPYNDLVMRILLSDMIAILEKFLICLNLGKDKVTSKKILVTELNDRKLFNLLIKELNSFQGKQSFQPENLLDGIFFSSKKTEYSISVDKQKGNDVNLTELARYLITYLLVKIPSIHYDLNIHKDLYNASPDFDFIDVFMKGFDIGGYIEFLKKNKFENVEIINIYYLLYLSKENVNDDYYFYEFKRFLNKHIDLFELSEQYSLYIKLESLAIEKIETGKIEFYEELFSIYSFMVKNDILTESKNDHIAPELFRNMVFTGTSLKKYKWTENFVRNFIDKISPELKDNVLNHSLAHMYFHMDEFKKSLECLNKIRYDLFAYKADVKILTMRIFYELSDYEPAYSLLDSFKKFVANNKNVSVLFRKRYNSFIKHYGRLLKLASGNDSHKLSDYEYEMTKDELLYNRKWFLTKMNSFHSTLPYKTP